MQVQEERGERTAKFFPRWDGPFVLLMFTLRLRPYMLDIALMPIPFIMPLNSNHTTQRSTTIPDRQLPQPGPTSPKMA